MGSPVFFLSCTRHADSLDLLVPLDVRARRCMGVAWLWCNFVGRILVSRLNLGVSLERLHGGLHDMNLCEGVVLLGVS
jgi:hypothetical protein